MLLTIVADDTTTDTVEDVDARLTALELTGDYLERLLTGLLAALDDDDAA